MLCFDPSTADIFVIVLGVTGFDDFIPRPREFVDEGIPSSTATFTQSVLDRMRFYSRAVDQRLPIAQEYPCRSSASPLDRSVGARQIGWLTW